MKSILALLIMGLPLHAGVSVSAISYAPSRGHVIAIEESNSTHLVIEGSGVVTRYASQSRFNAALKQEATRGM